MEGEGEEWRKRGGERTKGRGRGAGREGTEGREGRG